MELHDPGAKRMTESGYLARLIGNEKYLWATILRFN
jgi:hypothetical protein